MQLSELEKLEEQGLYQVSESVTHRGIPEAAQI